MCHKNRKLNQIITKLLHWYETYQYYFYQRWNGDILAQVQVK